MIRTKTGLFEEEDMGRVEHLLKIKEEQSILEEKLRVEEGLEPFEAKCRGWLQMADDRIKKWA
jgi:hypothetical protein